MPTTIIFPLGCDITRLILATCSIASLHTEFHNDYKQFFTTKFRKDQFYLNKTRDMGEFPGVALYFGSATSSIYFLSALKSFRSS